MKGINVFYNFRLYRFLDLELQGEAFQINLVLRVCLKILYKAGKQIKHNFISLSFIYSYKGRVALLWILKRKLYDIKAYSNFPSVVGCYGKAFKIKDTVRFHFRMRLITFLRRTEFTRNLCLLRQFETTRVNQCEDITNFCRSLSMLFGGWDLLF